GDGTGPSAFDVADSELVQAPRDGQLVGHRQGESLLLGAITKRGVVDVEPLVGHMKSVLWMGSHDPPPQNKRPLADARGLRAGGCGPKCRGPARYRRACR